MFNLVMLKNPSQILGYSVGYECVYRTYIGLMPVQFVLYTHELVAPAHHRRLRSVLGSTGGPTALTANLPSYYYQPHYHHHHRVLQRYQRRLTLSH